MVIEFWGAVVFQAFSCGRNVWFIFAGVGYFVVNS